MAEIRIRLIGNVAFENDMKLSEGFRYDIPVDRIGIPRIPIARLLPASVIGGRHVGFALPEGYLGLAAQAEKLARLRSDIVPLITACFTDKKAAPANRGMDALSQGRSGFLRGSGGSRRQGCL